MIAPALLSPHAVITTRSLLVFTEHLLCARPRAKHLPTPGTLSQSDLSCRGHLATSDDICGCHNPGQRACLHLVDEDERNAAKPSCKAQGGPSTREWSGPSASSVEAEKLSRNLPSLEGGLLIRVLRRDAAVQNARRAQVEKPCLRHRDEKGQEAPSACVQGPR